MYTLYSMIIFNVCLFGVLRPTRELCLFILKWRKYGVKMGHTKFLLQIFPTQIFINF